MQVVEVRLRSLDTEVLSYNLRDIVVDFCKKQGVEFFGKIFEIEHVGLHAPMVKRLMK